MLGLTPRQQRTFDTFSRRVEIAADTSPFPCKPAHEGRCVTNTYVGNYQPLPYLLPALAMRAGTPAGRHGRVPARDHRGRDPDGAVHGSR